MISTTRQVNQGDCPSPVPYSLLSLTVSGPSHLVRRTEDGYRLGLAFGWGSAMPGWGRERGPGRTDWRDPVPEGRIPPPIHGPTADNIPQRAQTLSRRNAVHFSAVN